MSYNTYDLRTLESVENDFLGLGKKARERRAAKKDARNDRKIARINARGANGGGILQKGGKAVMNLASTIFGGGQAPTIESATVDSGGVRAEFADPAADEKKTNWVPWIIVAVVLVIVITLVVIKMRKKKS